MCNKCQQFHSELFSNHHQYNIESEFFTGICTEKNHSNKLEYYCKNHNQLCCAQCIVKIKGKGNGKHKDCDVCFIKKIKNKKKNKLNENIQYLEELSKTIEQSLKDLKKIFAKINENKEKIKLDIQKLFTKLRSALNNREDELLLKVDNQFDNIFFTEELIKDSEKLPNKIKISLDRGKKIDNEWDDKNKLSSIINDCINIENNIKGINAINESIKKYNSIDNLEIKFTTKKNEIEDMLNNIKKFGDVYYDN